MAAGLIFLCGACGGSGNNGMEKLVEGKYQVTEKGEPVGFTSFTFDYLGGSDVMPIGGYWGPYKSGGSINGYNLPDLISDEIYGYIAEAGVNMIVRSQDTATFTSYSDVERGLKLAEKYNIGVFTPVTAIEALAGRSSNYKEGDQLPFSMSDFERLVRKFAVYDSFLGISVTDEPLWAQMAGMKRAYGLFEEIGLPEYAMYTNVLPYESGAGGFGGGAAVDEKVYFDKLFNDIKLPFMSATGYYYTQKDTPDSQVAKMFSSLSGLRKCSLEYGVPFWRMLQAGGQWNDSLNDLESVPAYPDEGELLFDVNIALAYGCKAIQYFPLIQPSHFAYASGGTYDFNRNGIVSLAGKKTQWFYYVQKANKQIAAVDYVLMNSANMGLIAYGEKAIALSHSYDETREEFIKDGTFRQLTGLSGDDAFVGCFDYKGGTALYVVNYNRKEKANVTLHFDGYYGYEVIQRAVSAEVMGEQLNLTLECGEGVLVVLK